MTTSLLERVPVDEITAQAREIRFGYTILTFLAAIFYALGWITAKVFTALWLALTWSWTAIRIGWQEARMPRAEDDT